MRSIGSAVLALSLAALLAPSLASAKDEAATVVCKDGSSSKGGRGACRGHGGVDKKASAQGGSAAAPAATATKEPEKATAKAEDDSAPTVVCKDGATSKGGRGACRGHGGVDKKASAQGGSAAAPAAAASTAAAATAAAATTAAAPAKVAPATKVSAPAGKGADEGKGPPTAKCKDGSMSYSQHHTGACSRHGGVAEWLDKK